MKKSISLALLASIICLITTIAVVSCKHQHISCDSCTMKAPNKTLSVDVGKVSNIETKMWDENNSYHFGSSRSLSDEEISYITHDFFGQPVEAGVQEVSVVIYTNKSHNSSEAKSINKDDIQGYSVYFSKDKRFRHRFFLKGDDGIYRIVPELNCETRSISANNIFSISDVYFNDRFNEISAIEMTNLPRYANIIDNKLYRSNTLRSTVKYLERKHLGGTDPNGNAAARPSGATCKAPCPSQETDKACEKKSSGSYSCLDTFDEGGTIETAAAAIAFETGNYSYEQLDSAYNYELEYEFRDSFMSQYNLGTKLIGYYYSVNVSSYVSISNIANITNLMYAVNPQVQKLLDYQKYNIGGSTVFIDNTLKTQIISQLNAFKAVAKTQNDIDMFDDIINDVNTYANLTMSQVMTTIN